VGHNGLGVHGTGAGASGVQLGMVIPSEGGDAGLVVMVKLHDDAKLLVSSNPTQQYPLRRHMHHYSNIHHDYDGTHSFHDQKNQHQHFVLAMVDHEGQHQSFYPYGD
jgi:hypothetical protein